MGTGVSAVDEAARFEHRLGDSLRPKPGGLAITIHDIAAARLRTVPLDPSVERDLREIASLSMRLIEELEHG